MESFIRKGHPLKKKLRYATSVEAFSWKDGLSAKRKNYFSTFFSCRLLNSATFSATFFPIQRIDEPQDECAEDIADCRESGCNPVDSGFYGLCLGNSRRIISDSCKCPSAHSACDCLSNLSREGVHAVDHSIITSAVFDFTVIYDICNQCVSLHTETLSCKDCNEGNSNIYPYIFYIQDRYQKVDNTCG